jgi:hypothetical protein
MKTCIYITALVIKVTTVSLVAKVDVSMVTYSCRRYCSGYANVPKCVTLQTFPILLNIKLQLKSWHISCPSSLSCGKALFCKICTVCYLCVLTLQSPDRNGNPGCGADPHWSITVEQFVATLLTGQPIVEFFGRQTSLSDGIMKMRGRRFNRLHSLSDTAFVKVWRTDRYVNNVQRTEKGVQCPQNTHCHTQTGSQKFSTYQLLFFISSSLAYHQCVILR